MKLLSLNIQLPVIWLFFKNWKPIKFKNIKFCARYFPTAVNVDVYENAMVLKLCSQFWCYRFCFWHYGYGLIAEQSFCFGALLQQNLYMIMSISSCMSDVLNPFLSIFHYVTFLFWCFLWSQIAVFGFCIYTGNINTVFQSNIIFILEKNLSNWTTSYCDETFLQDWVTF